MQFVWNSNHGRLAYGFVTVEHLFDDAWIDVHAVDNHHVFDAVDDVEIVIFILGPEIARAKPVAEKRFRGFLRLLPVALHHIRAAYTDFADLIERLFVPLFIHDLHLNAGNGLANRQGLAHSVDRVEAGDRRALGRAIALINQHAEAIFKLLHNFGGHRRAAGDAKAELLNGGRIFFRKAQEEVVHARHAKKNRRVGRGNHLRGQSWIELWNRNQRRSVEKGDQHSGHGRKSVEHWEDNEEAFLAGAQLERFACGERIAHQIGVRQHRAFWFSGCS